MTSRALHLRALEAQYKERMGALLGRPVEAFVGVNHIDPDLSVWTFLLGD